MKVVFLLGLVAFATLFQSSAGHNCGECKKCWNYKHCEINAFPWTKRRYYAVFITQVTLNNFWGGGDDCGVFNQCAVKSCGCIGMDVSYISGRSIKGQWFSYHRGKKIQYMRRYYAQVEGNNAIITFFFSSEATWILPAVVVKKITCDECGNVVVESYKVPEAEMKIRTVTYKVKAIMILLKIKFRFLVFCSGLKGISDNKPFLVVLATMRDPSKKTWEKIKKGLLHKNFEPHSMVILRHHHCAYPPFDWSGTWVEPRNPSCDDICKVDK